MFIVLNFIVGLLLQLFSQINGTSWVTQNESSIKSAGDWKLVMHGDSQMGYQYEALWRQLRFTSAYMIHNAGKACTTCQGLASLHLACPAVQLYRKSQGYIDEKFVVYLNFASLHLLHMHVEEENLHGKDDRLWNSLTGAYTNYGGDFNGWLNLEKWMEDEIDCLSKSGSAQAIIIQTPHFVRDEKYTKFWRSFINRIKEAPESALRSCATAVSNNNKDTNYTTALQYCKEGLFTGLGSSLLANRMTAFVKERYDCTPLHMRIPSKIPPVCLMDAHNITKMAQYASATVDGRHYDVLTVREELYGLNRTMEWLGIPLSIPHEPPAKPKSTPKTYPKPRSRPNTFPKPPKSPPKPEP